MEVSFEDWSGAFPMTLELVRGKHVAGIPITKARGVLRLDGLAFERPSIRVDLPASTPVRRPFRLKAAVRSALDWETITPVDELGDGSPSLFLKKTLRRWRDRLKTR